MKKTILIYEPHYDQVPHLIFLLQLTDISCTHARTAQEALNWLEAARLKIISFDLVLVCSWWHQETETELLNELQRMPLPLFLLQRGDDVPPPLRQIAIDICSPENLSQCLHSHLTAKASLPAKGETNDCC